MSRASRRVLAVLAILAAATSSADTLVWTGKGDDARFSNIFNWKSDGSHVVPQTGDTLDFTGVTAPATVTNDIANLRVATIADNANYVVWIDGELEVDEILDNVAPGFLVVPGRNGRMTVDMFKFFGNNQYAFYQNIGELNVGAIRFISSADATQNGYLFGAGEYERPFAVSGIVNKVEHNNTKYQHNLYLHGNGKNGEFILGGDGLSFEYGDTGTQGYVFGIQANRTCTIHPMADWSLALGIFPQGDIDMKAGARLVISTTDYFTSAPRTITLNGSIYDEGNLSPIDITGCGKVVVNSVTRNDVSKSKNVITVKDTAVLEVNGGKDIGGGDVTMEAGTTLSFPGAKVATAPFGQSYTARFLSLAAGSKVAYTNGLSESVVPFSVPNLVLPDSGTVEISIGGEPLADGIYPLFRLTQGLALSPAEYAAKFSFTGSGLPAKWELAVYGTTGDTLALVAGAGVSGKAFWTGAGDGVNFADASNWAGGVLPSSGDEVHFTVASGALVNNLAAFAPKSITFEAGIGAGLSISGNAISGISAVTNLSTSVTPVFEAPVAFAGAVNVSQLATATSATVSGTTVRFAGGATGAAPAAAQKFMYNGRFELTGTETTPFAATSSSNDLRQHILPDSSVSALNTGDTTELDICNGGAFTTGVRTLTAGKRLWTWNYGEYVVTNEVMATGLSGSASMDMGWAQPSVAKLEKVTIGGTGTTAKYFRIGNGGGSAQVTLYVGKGGLNIKSGSNYMNYWIGGSSSGNADTAYIRPWYSDFSVTDNGASNSFFGFGRDGTVIDTDDENGVGRTVTFNCIANGSKTVAVRGSGVLRFNKVNTHTGAITVWDSATLALGRGAKSGTGAVTAVAGAAVLLADASVKSYTGNLVLNRGASLVVSNLTSGVTALEATKLEPGAEQFLKLEGPVLANGSYNIAYFSSTAPTAAAAASFRPCGSAIEGKSATLSVSGNYLVLTVADGTTPFNPVVFVWTGKGDGTRFSDGANWNGGVAPAGTIDMIVFPFADGISVANDIEGISVEKIIFSGVGPITVGGQYGFTVREGVYNSYNKECKPVFNVPVAFTGAINVYQNATSTSNNKNTASGDTVRFAAGVTGLTMASLTSATACTRFLYDGHFFLPEGYTWHNYTAGDGGRQFICDNSSLTVDIIGRSTSTSIGKGGAITGATAAVESEQRLWTWNAGEFVVTEKVSATLVNKKDIQIGYQYDSTGKFEKVTLSGGGADNTFFRMGNSNAAAKTTVFVGAGGLGFEPGATNLWFFTDAHSGAKLFLRPWHSDFTVDDSAVVPGTCGIGFNNTTEIDTIDENGVPREITFDCSLIYGGAVTVKGAGGVLRFNRACSLNALAFYGSWTAVDGVTLAVGPSGDFGNADVSLASGTKFRFENGVNTQFPKSLVLPSEAASVTFEFEGATLADGVYTLFTVDNALADTVPGAIAISGSALTGASPARTLYLSNDRKSLCLAIGSSGQALAEYVWTGAAGDGKMATPGNWVCGSVPSAGGEAVSFPSASGTIVNDIAAFAPQSITFGEGIGELAITGNDITGVGAVTNLSAAVTPVINAKVYFAGDIVVNVKANTGSAPAVSGTNVDFRGGAWGDTIPGGHVAYLGALHRTSETPFESTVLGNDRVIVIGSLTTKELANTGGLYIKPGGAITAETARVTNGGTNYRMVVGNGGEYVVTGVLEKSTEAAMASIHAGDQTWRDASTGGVFKAGTFNVVAGSMGLDGNNAACETHWYIGAGGMNTSGSATFYNYFADDRTYIHPWKSDFALSAGSTAPGDLYIGATGGTGGTIIFVTDDEDGVARKIAINGKVACREAVKDASHIEVTGSGTLEWNNTESTFYGDIKIGEGSTFVFGSAAATPGAATLDFAPGATLVLPAAGSGAVAFGGISFSGEGKVNLVLGDGGAIAEGAYDLLAFGGNDPADLVERFTLANSAAAEAKFVMTGTGRLALVVGDATPVVDEYVWTGAAGDGRFATAGNWLGGAAPATGGEKVLFPVGVGTVVNDIAAFAPDTITFGSGITDGFTISGNDITVGSTITNLSKTANAVFAAHVTVVSSDPFLQVAQSAEYNVYAEIRGGLKGLVVFAGGVENEKAIGYNSLTEPYDIYAGHYVRTGDSDYTSVIDTKWRQIITPGSSLTVKSAGDTSYLYIADGGAFTAKVATAGSRLVQSCRGGEYVVNGMLLHDSSSEFNFCYSGSADWASHSDGGAVKAKGVQINGGAAGLAGTGAYATTNHWYIGELGMNTTPGNSAFFFTRNVADRVYIHPWKSDFAINSGSTGVADLYLGAGSQKGGTVVFATDDEDGVARTITINGKVACREAVKNNCGIEITGAGRVVWNSVSDFRGDIRVKDTASLLLNPGAKTGPGYVYLASGATLGVPDFGWADMSGNAVVFSAGATLSFKIDRDGNGGIKTASGKLGLPGDGTVTVKFAKESAATPGRKYVLTDGAGLSAGDESKFALAEGFDGALSIGAEGTEEEGELVYTAPAMFFIRIVENGAVKIPVDWVAQNVSPDCTDMDQTCANGIPVWQNWCLGLAPNDPRSVIVCEAADAQPSGGIFAIAAKNLDVLASSGATVTAYLDKSPDGENWANVSSQDVESGAVAFNATMGDGETRGFFRIRVAVR